MIYLIMTLTFIVMVAICFIIMSRKGKNKKEDAEYIWFLLGTFLTIVAVIFCIVIPIITYCGHIKDVSIINKQNLMIEIAEKRLLRLNELSGDIKLNSNSLVNADSPIASFADQIAEAIKEVAFQKSIKAEAEISIEARRLSVYRFIVDLIPME